jgi:nitrate reductase gamma subunit
MPVTAIIYATLYAAALVFLAGCVARAVRYARAPLHLRWEVYPVPHEAPERARHGGSYFEETDWWTRPAQSNLLGELKAMVPEMLFLKGLWEFNRRLWYRSFAFHLGLYLLIATAALLVLGALLLAAAPGLIFGTAGRLLHHVYLATGLAGAALALAGALGLLHRRLTDEELANCTTAGDIFNLLFFLVTLGTLAAGYVFAGPQAPGVLTLAYGLLRFDTALQIPPVLAAGLILAALLAAYIPFTHMSHFIAKYFTYHSVRWDDTPGRRSIELQKRFAEYLTYRPTWSAPHVGADGAKSWADIAAANPAQGAKK